MNKRCELCKSKAMIYCDSDSASLCWSCDAKVHSANFLVARHSRTLLCQTCQSPTPWTACGTRIGPTTASICGRCVVEGASDDDDDDTEERVEGNDSEIGMGGIEIELEDSNDDNLVVPPCSSSSEDLEFSICGGHGGGLLKRKRWNVPDLNSEPEEEIDSSSVNINRNPSIGDETTSSHTSESTVRKLKIIRHRNPTPGNGRSRPTSKILIKNLLEKIG